MECVVGVLAPGGGRRGVGVLRRADGLAVPALAGRPGEPGHAGGESGRQHGRAGRALRGLSLPAGRAGNELRGHVETPKGKEKKKQIHVCVSVSRRG